MTVLTNTFEGGTNGSNVTVANSGGASGTPFAVVVLGTGATITYTTAWKTQGTVGCAINLGSSGSSYLRLDTSEPGSRGVMRRPLIIPSSPTGTIVLMQLKSLTSDVLMANVNLLTTRTIRIAPSAVILTASESPVLDLNTIYWIELACTSGTTTSNGRLEIRITKDSDGSVVHTYDTGATVNTGIEAPGHYRFSGFSTASSGWTTDYLDELRVGIQASGWLGALATATLGTITVTWDGSTWR